MLACSGSFDAGLDLRNGFGLAWLCVATLVLRAENFADVRAAEQRVALSHWALELEVGWLLDLFWLRRKLKLSLLALQVRRAQVWIQSFFVDLDEQVSLQRSDDGVFFGHGLFGSESIRVEEWFAEELHFVKVLGNRDLRFG